MDMPVTAVATGAEKQAANAMGAPTPVDPPRRDGRLFRKYFILILALVTAALLVPSSISLYFSYRDTLSALHSVQQEKAVAAAGRIEQYIVQVQNQLRGAALPQLGADASDQRRMEFLKLLKQVPDVTDIAYIGADGCEKAQVSRLAMDSSGECLRDRSKEPAFTLPTASRAYYGPVYFRKETEPYMQIAVRSASAGPATVADVNLKFMWDAITRIRIGEKGKAYVVDSNGYLIADPDIGLVLRKTDLNRLAHVHAALAAGGTAMPVAVTQDASGAEVLTAYASVDPTGWKVFVEQPAAEVTSRLNDSIWRTAMLLLGGLLISALAALFLARGMARPIRTLQEGAQLIGAGKLDHAIEVKTGDELEALAGQFNHMTARLRESYAGLERKVVARTEALQRSLEQQTAISEILRVISASPTDVQPVMDAVAARAAHLCDAAYARILLIEGSSMTSVAQYESGHAAHDLIAARVPLDRTSLLGRAAIDRQSVHLADVVPLLDSEFPGAKVNMLRFNLRAVLAVPLMREGGAYGGIILARRDPGLFAADQVSLVETFARQAAIAIDNVRLFNETTTALEQQTATSEILNVISRSHTDVQPVFDTIAAAALKLCGARSANVVTYDGELIHVAALAPSSGQGNDAIHRHFSSYPRPPSNDTANTRAILTRSVVMIPDVLADAAYAASEAAAAAGYRSVLSVPLLRDGQPLGAITVARPKPGPFPREQSALLQTFADQAVMAIENVRLFNDVQNRTREVSEALDQQRASGEVLAAISNSIADTAPVFDAILAGCERLFAGTYSGIMLVKDGALEGAAVRGPGLEELRNLGPIPVNRDLASGAAIVDGKAVDFPDVDAPDFPPRARENSQFLAYKSIAAAPLMIEGRSLGALWVGRPVKGAFGEKNLAMLKTFADQAVIAIENARLFNETKTALEQQTATADVLKVISRSTFDLQTVLDTLVESAARLCQSEHAWLFRRDGDVYRYAASHGLDAGEHETIKAFMVDQRIAPGRGSAIGRAALERRAIQVTDVLADPDYTWHDFQSVGRYRTALAVPLLREGVPIGLLGLTRTAVRPFTEQQIELATTFADQAVIAIENVRLFEDVRTRTRELTESLDQQRASGEVLATISSSIADTAPVFDHIMQSCQRLFAGLDVGLMRLRDDGMLELGAYLGPAREALERLFPRPLDRNSGSGLAILDRRVTQFPDMDAPDVPWALRQGGGSAGNQSMVFAPMLFEDHALGALWVGRDFKGAFSDKQLALLKTFADQAVIAIQNARLVNETREALGRQTAISEILRVISGSPTDVRPVLKAVAERAARICEADDSRILLAEGGSLQVTMGDSYLQGPAEGFSHPIEPGWVAGRAFINRRPVHVLDLQSDDAFREYPAGARIACEFGVRTTLCVPLLRENAALGVILLRRSAVKPFDDKQIALLETFADQAAIAIENVRLFNETNEALEQQTATAEVLKAISRTTFELQPVLATLIENATRLARSDSGFVFIREGELFHLMASFGCPPNDVEYMRANPTPPGPGSLAGRVALTRQIVQIEDAASDPTYRRNEAQQRIGFRTMLGVPMLREGEPIGVLALWRNDVRPFGGSETRMAASFADAAVIAIENVRLFREIQDKSRQLEAANQHKSEFLANMSHELRTPLNAIIGFSEVLVERMFGELNEKQDDYLKDILSSGRHLLMLINDILDLSKVEAGRMELEPAQFHVPTAISNAMTLVRERAQRHDITLGTQVDPALDEIVADERKFKQILVNLLTNAVKFTPDGGRVDVIARRVGNDLEVAVRDTGIGIAREDQDAVFEEFRQVGRHYTNKQEGTGLGLTLTRRFVELHGGRIWLESEPGLGSTFTFAIPYRTWVVRDALTPAPLPRGEG